MIMAGDGKEYFVDAEAGSDSASGCSPDTAWRSLGRLAQAGIKPGDTIRLKRGSVWRESLHPVSGSEDGVVTYTSYGEGDKPLLLGSFAVDREADWYEVKPGIWATKKSVPRAESPRSFVLSEDIGNIIFDHGAACGWKKWSLESLENPLDYFYDNRSLQVFLRCDGNPAGKFDSIELARRKHIVDQGGARYVVYDGLELKYGAAHGFGGGDTVNLTIRNCDVSYIGGGHQHTRDDGMPVRYGNGIEFWAGARDNLVEGCRLWEIYDAALTNQNKGATVREINITYRNNVVWNCEYSFEYWNRPESSETRNVRFINNTCVNAGVVWSHSQRPDPNGSHLMLYTNSAQSSGIEIRYNVFCQSTDWGSRFSSGWEPLPDIDYNLWFETDRYLCYFFKERLPANDVEGYRKATGFDLHSLFADPKFLNPAGNDFRLSEDSPARKIRPDGGIVGADSLW